tara:strand:+ start:6040 stop:7872 length:1833 start_codon:yes stop_codon:yes gene_type:complete
MPRIREIEIKNFRSIRRLKVDITDFSVFVGDNDAGKSNILRALNLFFNSETDPGRPYNFELDYNRFSNPGRRAKQVEIEVTLELPENYWTTNGQYVVWKKTWRRDGLHFDTRKCVRTINPETGEETYIEFDFPARSRAPGLLNKIDFEYIPAIRSANYFGKLRGRIYGVISEFEGDDFENSSMEFETAIGARLKDLKDQVQSGLGDDVRMSLPQDLGAIFERLDFVNGDGAISLDARGDGIKARYIPLILKFIADQRKAQLIQGGLPYTFIWAYEEPENNLEFRRATELATNLANWAQNDDIQILATTHSPVIYNAAEDIIDKEGNAASIQLVKYCGPQDGTTVEKSGDDLDKDMGVTAFIAPYVRDVQEKIERYQSELKTAERALYDLERSCVFVEGTTDYRIFNHIIRRFRPDLANHFVLRRPPGRGAGTSYVAANLGAWENLQRVKPVDERLRAFGIFDGDEAARDSIVDLEASYKGANQYIKWCRLEPTDPIIAARQAGFLVPMTLEEAFPIEWWEHAENRGYLERRDRRAVLSSALEARILNEETTFDEELDPEWGIYARSKVRGESKEAFVRWVLQRPEAELRREFRPLIYALRQAVAWIGVQG